MAKDSEDKKRKILKLYYEDNLIQKEVAEKLGITQGYVSQVVKEDERYIAHKEEKHKNSLEKKAIYNKEYYKTYERPKKDDDSYKQLQAQLNKDTAELSSAGGYISDFDFAKWNPNAYECDKNGNLKLENANLKLSTVYENYIGLEDNSLDLISFICDYKENSNSNFEENEEEIIMNTKSRSENKYIQQKKLYINKQTQKPTKLIIQDNNQNTKILIQYKEIQFN